MSKEARKRLLDRRKAIQALIAEVDKDEAQLQGAGTPIFSTAPPTARPSRSWSRSGTPPSSDELVELEATLERIEKGAYGTCQTCGGAVGRQRLRAIPEARFCIECVSMRSRRAVAS